MGIIASLKPLYDNLVKIGLEGFINNNEFVRICNELGITEHYATSNNEAVKQADARYGFLL
jgi:hypothetical protein